jgi:hypothetical protein
MSKHTGQVPVDLKPGDWVRIAPQAFRNYRGQHYLIAQVVELRGVKVAVRVIHRSNLETVGLQHVVLWKSRSRAA